MSRFLTPCGQWSCLFLTFLLRYSSFDIHIYFWNQHCYQGNDQIYRPKSCLVPLWTPSLWPLTGLISPAWGNHSSAVSRDKFTFPRVLNKWNLRVSILFGLVSFTLPHYFNIYPCHCSDSSILLLHTLSLYGYNSVHPVIYWWASMLFPGWMLTNKLLWTSGDMSLYGHRLSFLFGWI